MRLKADFKRVSNRCPHIFSGHLLRSFKRLEKVGVELVGDIPGQKFFDAIDRVFG
jgi:hypothetical protein